MGLAHHPALLYVNSLFGLVFMFFGFTYMLDPVTGFSYFGFTPPPTTKYDWELMKHVMVLYGAKDLFMAVSIFATTWCGSRKSAGMVVLAGGLCAAVDGGVVKAQSGGGEWNHWGYGSMMVGVGGMLMGMLG